MLLLQKDEATAAQRRIPLILVDATDGVTAETGITFSGAEIRVSKNGAAFADFAGAVTEREAGDYYYEATAGEVDTIGYFEIRTAKAGVRVFRGVAQIVPWDPYDATRMGLGALPNAAAEAAGGLYTRGTGAGQVNQSANGQLDSKTVTQGAGTIGSSAFAAGAVDAVALSTDAAQEIADAHLDRADAIETGLTPRQAHRLEAAAAAGVLAGAATTTVTIKNAVAASKTRITATVDADGNRSAVVTDVT